MRWDALFGGALGSAIGLVGGLALAPRPVSTARPPADSRGSRDASTSMDVLAELRAIRELLAKRPADPAPTRSGATGPGAGTEPPVSDEVVAALASLEHAVRSASADVAPASPPAGLRSSEEGVGTPRSLDLGALRTTRASMDGQGQQVLPELFGLSPAQVYERFGTPAVVGNSPGRVRWLYEDPDYPGHLVVTFFDGYVGWIHVTTE